VSIFVSQAYFYNDLPTLNIFRWRWKPILHGYVRGSSVTNGQYSSLNRTVAYKQAAQNAIAYLMKVCTSLAAAALIHTQRYFERLDIVSQKGLSSIRSLTIDIAREQAYLLLSAAPIESHIGAIVVSTYNLHSDRFSD
jgi:hypothetical protein